MAKEQTEKEVSKFYPVISIKEYADKYGVSYDTMRRRIHDVLPKRKAGKLRPNEHKKMEEFFNKEL